MSAFLSGEMSDTVQMNPAGAYGLFIDLCRRMIVLSLSISFGKILLAQGTKGSFPFMGRKCKYVDQGLSYIDSSLDAIT